MKLLFIDFNHSLGGGQVYIRNVINQLTKMDIECWLVSNNPQGLFSTINLPTKYCLEVPNKYSSFFKISRIINALVKKVRITHVILNGNRASYLSPFIRNDNKIMITHSMPQLNHGIKYLITKYALKIISGYFIKHIITLSNIQKCQLIDLGINKNKIDIIYNGINMDFLLPKEKIDKEKKEIIITQIANIEKHKGYKESINVFIELLNKYDYIKFWIIGAGTDKKFETYLKKKVENDKKTRNKIIFWGYQEDVKIFLKCTDIFILPSYNECLPISILEAMACSIPIVASNVGGVPEIIENGVNGYIIQPKNENELYNRLELLINNFAIREKIAYSNFQKCKDKFLNIESVKKLVDVLDGIK